MERKEIEIQGNLANLDPFIAQVAAESHFKGCDFEVRQSTSVSNRKDTYPLYDVSVIDRTATSPSKILIGAFTLQLLGNNKIMLRVPPPSRHTWGHLSPLEKIQIGLNKDRYNDHINYFIEKLENELKDHGFIATWYKKIWQGIEDHKIISILGALASIAAIVGVVVAILSYIRG